MKRDILQTLLEWKNSPLRKPLILRGARQVGKTWIIENFSAHFDNFVEINFEMFPDSKRIFERDLDPKRLIRDLILFSGKKNAGIC